MEDRSLPYILFFGVSAISQIPAITVLYLANMDKPVYLGSLQQYIPDTFIYTRRVAFVIFLLYETFLTAATVFNSLTLCTIFMLMLQGGRYWIEQIW